MEPGLIFLFVLLAAIWGAFLFPEVFANRKDAPLNSTEEFGRWTSKLGSVAEKPGRRGRRIRTVTRGAVLSRRRRFLVLLLLSAVGTLVAALMTGSRTLLFVHIGIDAAVAWYVAMLVQIKQRRRLASASAAVAEAKVAPVVEEESPVRVLAIR